MKLISPKYQLNPNFLKLGHPGNSLFKAIGGAVYFLFAALTAFTCAMPMADALLPKLFLT